MHCKSYYALEARPTALSWRQLQVTKSSRAMLMGKMNGVSVTHLSDLPGSVNKCIHAPE